MSDQRPMPPHSPASGYAALEQAGASPLRARDPGQIGPYVPLGLLGSGGMGRVYLARPAEGTPGLAAVKVIRPEYAEDPRFRRRFEREASVHTRLRTPHAPHLLGSGFEDELLWMATRYLPGLNLADAVRECGALEPAGVWKLVAELGRALSALAAAGVVHRDLKPSNVILSPQGAHVIDFGIARAVDSSSITTTGNRVGTPAYMAPEYLREGRCDTASDVFSLACTIVYAATRRAPFGDGTGVDVMHRVAFEEPKQEVMAELTSAAPALAALLSACLAKDPVGRPTPQQLVDAAAATGHGPTPSWQEPLATRLLARQRGCQLLERSSAEETGHFRAPTPPERHRDPATPPVQDASSAAPPTGEHADRRKRQAPYLAIAGVIAVFVVAAGAFLLTRPDFYDTALASPTASTDVTHIDGPASVLPGSSASPSATGEKKPGTEEAKEEAREDADSDSSRPAGRAGGAGATPDGATATSGSADTGSGDSAPAPTGTATRPATPPWISECTHYSGTELTRRGDRGRRVVQVQCMLTERGYDVGGTGEDGRFGKDTDAAVRKFQRAGGLNSHGKVGPETWAALRSSK
ncbi:protein kinase [Streptomyces sp. D2-8]|uniref:serine/threonine-protein kinase n=1 Tax=Streptomyces sp. D2-8 TaxID=2707767 RepID=UPI0020C12847|nr:serine/threonine-protein kinase [Streptomyces sp. D2-8]MCK8435247.1 protein kinase [Streptomyces sp. D2-8]